MKLLRNAIIPSISETMLNLGIDENDWSGLIGNATDLSHGDIAIPCHSLSRILKRSPKDIADDISTDLEMKLLHIATTSSINGFVNFKATDCTLPADFEPGNLVNKIGEILNPTR